jgi:putative transposase
MKYQFIAAHQQEYPVKTMCRILEVASSGFYAWQRGGGAAPPPRPGYNGVGGAHRAHLSCQSASVWEPTHPCGAARAISQACGKKRVARLMRELGLSAKPRKHRTRTTDSKHEQPVAPNLLNREFTATAPKQKVY